MGQATSRTGRHRLRCFAILAAHETQPRTSGQLLLHNRELRPLLQRFRLTPAVIPCRCPFLTVVCRGPFRRDGPRLGGSDNLQ